MSDTLAHPATRVAWVDYSKGICIFLVLMLHANAEITMERGSSGWLQHIVDFARPFRMPDFFLIAGLFLNRFIDRPLAYYLDRKVIHFAYFYLLWTAFYFVLFGIKTALDQSNGDWSAVLPAYLMTFIQPNSSLWFIHSLAVFFLIVRLCRNVPWWIMLGIGAALQMANVQTEWTAIDEFCRRFVYFYSGYFLAKYIFAIADWGMAHRKGVLSYLAVWAVINGWLVIRGWASLPGLGLALGYVGAVAVVFMGVLLCSVSWTRALRYIGEHSIVLYLADYFVQRVALKLGIARVPDPGSAAMILTFISVGGTLAMYWIATRIGIDFPYRRPDWARLQPRRGPAVNEA